MRFTISKKLILGFLSVSLFLGGTSGVFFYYLTKVNYSYTDINDRRTEILNNVKYIQVLAYRQTNSLRGYLLTEKPEFISDLKAENREMNTLINETSNLVTEAENKQAVKEIAGLNREFQTKYEKLLMNFEIKIDKEYATDYFINELLPIGTQLFTVTTALADRQQYLMDEARVNHNQQVNQMKQMIILFSIIAIILNIIIGLTISKNITNNLSKITKVIKKLSANSGSEIPLPEIEVRSRDEIQDIATAFNNMAKSIKEKSWLETSIAGMATMYQGIHDLQTLGQRFINKITPIVGGNYGVFYVKQGREEARFHCLAAYAFNGKEISSTSFGYGEGIVGQAALEKRTIHLTDLPKGYIQIGSGVGAASPANLIVIPVEYEGEVIVVIEIASFSQFTKSQQTLLNQVANQIGITVKSVEGRMQIEKLLRESKALTEELQSQSEELQQQHEELIHMNERIEEQYRNSEQKSIELNNIKLELEEKAKQLELNSNYKSEFLANMSHELRSPLNSLLILANLLVENKDGNLTKQQVDFADTIFKSGKELLQLINEVLDLSKIESGKIDCVPSEVKLKNICLFVERQFLPLAKKKGLTLSINLEENLPNCVWTDQHRLQQILRNLLSNAIKFTEKGKVVMDVHLADEKKHPQREDIQAILAFAIKDTGIGIPAEKREIIFQAFQQGDGTTSRKYGGTGLGLSISREIAHLLGGEITVESNREKGSTFTLYLPIYSVEQPLTMQNEAAVSVEESKVNVPLEENENDILLKEKKILIVDDDMRNIFAVTTALESKQMNIDFVNNGKECIEFLRQNSNVDLILMDIMMPEMDGYETIRQIRKDSKFKELPIIALTAKAMKMDKEKCFEVGASDYISKPVFIDQLLSLMQVWLHK